MRFLVLALLLVGVACKKTPPEDQAGLKGAGDAGEEIPNVKCLPSAELKPGDVLKQGEALCAGNFTAVLQGDGNFVVYSKGGVKRGAMWSSKTNDGVLVRMQSDCNLVMANAADASPWNTGTSDLTYPKCSAIMQGDGNFVLYKDGKGIWSTNTRGYCRSSPRLDVGEGMTQGEALCNGNFFATLQGNGDFVLYLFSGAEPVVYWRAQTSSTSKAEMQSDCNFVLYDAAGASTWSSKSADASKPKCFAQLQDDGNLVVYQENPLKVVWNSDAARALQEVPTDESTFMICKCNDMECWRKVTNERSANSFKCAANAIGGAFPVMDIPIQMGLAAVEIYEAQDALKKISLSLSEIEKTGELVEKVSDGTCVGGIAAAIKGSAGLASKSGEMALSMKTIVELGKKGEISLSSVKDLVKASKDLVTGLIGLTEDYQKLAKCIPESGKTIELAKSWKSMGTALVSTQKAWGKLSIGGKFDVASRVGTCAVDIFKGGAALAQNTKCLVDDLEKLQQSYADLKAARDRVLASNAPNPDPNKDTCNTEPKNDSTYAMKKYGIWLYEKNNFSQSRSYECGRYCSANGGNARGPGSGESYCQKYVNDIFGGESEGCKETCTISQGDRAWELCTSYCCDQDEGCTQKAQRKAREYGYR